MFEVPHIINGKGADWLQVWIFICLNVNVLVSGWKDMVYAFGNIYHHEVCHPGGHYCSYYPGTIYLKQVNSFGDREPLTGNFMYIGIIALIWFLETVYPYLSPCQILKTCHEVPEFMNKMNPGYFPLAATALKSQQIPMFLHISARVWGRRWSPHTAEQKGSMLKPQQFIN